MEESSPTSNTVTDPSTATTQILNSTVQVETITIFRSGTDMTLSTITGSILSVPTSFLDEPVTRTLDQVRLLTGACTDITLARITDRAGQVFEYPQIGCAADLPQCCPFAFLSNVLLANCPVDHHTVVQGTYRACCPTSFELYYSGIAGQTPCYSNLSYPLVPSTSVPSEVILQTKTALARSFQLAEKPAPENQLTVGAIVGIVLGALLGIGLIIAAAALLYRRRQQQKQPLEISSPIQVPTESSSRESKMQSVTLGYSPDQHVPALPPHYSHEDSQSDLYSQRDTHVKHLSSPTLPPNIYELPPFGEHPAFRGQDDNGELTPAASTPNFTHYGYEANSPVSPNGNVADVRPDPLYLRKHLGVNVPANN